MSTVVLSQKKAEKLYGKWSEKSINGKSPIECPYQIHFEKANYKILNVCYGLDPKLPVTEDGVWSYDSTKNTITLKNRKSLDNNDLFHEPKSTLNVHVKEYKTNSISIYFDSEKSLTVLQRLK
jgi:hypothetical protein